VARESDEVRGQKQKLRDKPGWIRKETKVSTYSETRPVSLVRSRDGRRQHKRRWRGSEAPTWTEVLVKEHRDGRETCLRKTCVICDWLSSAVAVIVAAQSTRGVADLVCRRWDGASKVEDRDGDTSATIPE
jgi:hypothetical protein